MPASVSGCWASCWMTLKGMVATWAPRRAARQHVQRVAHAGHQHLGLEVVVSVDLDDLGDHLHAVLADVVQAAHEGADVGGAGLGAQQRLVGAEDQGHVGLDALGGERLARPSGPRRPWGSSPPRCGGSWRGSRPSLTMLPAVSTPPRRRSGPSTMVQISLMVSSSGAADLGEQRRVGGDAVHAAHGVGRADLVHVGGVDEELHWFGRAPGRVNRSRTPSGASLVKVAPGRAAG